MLKESDCPEGAEYELLEADCDGPEYELPAELEVDCLGADGEGPE